MRIVKNVSLVSLAMIWERFVTFIINVILARLLQPARYGAFAYSISFGASLENIATFGTGKVLTREISRKDQSEEFKKEILGAVILIKLFLILLTLAIGLFISKSRKGSLFLPAIMYLGSRLIFQFGETGSAVLMGYSLFNLYSLYIFIYRAILLAGILTLTISKFVSLTSIFSIYIAAALVYTFFAFNNALRLLSGRFPRSSVLLWCFKESLPFGLQAAVVGFYLNYPILLITKLLGTSQTGIFAASYKLITATYFVPAAITGVLYPEFSKLHSENNKKFINWINLTFTVNLTLATLIALFLKLSSPFLIRLIYGNAFQKSIFFLSSLTAILIPSYLANLLHTILGASRKQFFSLLIYLTSLGILIAAGKPILKSSPYGPILIYLLVESIPFVGLSLTTFIFYKNIGLIWKSIAGTFLIAILSLQNRFTLIIVPFILTIIWLLEKDKLYLKNLLNKFKKNQ